MGMEPLFKRTLQARMEYYPYDPNADKISKIQSQTGEVKGIMIDNMEKVLERGEKIGDIERKTEGMKVQAFRYRKKAKEVKKKMWWKNAKCWCFLVVVECHHHAVPRHHHVVPRHHHLYNHHHHHGFTNVAGTSDYLGAPGRSRVRDVGRGYYSSDRRWKGVPGLVAVMLVFFFIPFFFFPPSPRFFSSSWLPVAS